MSVITSGSDVGIATYEDFIQTDASMNAAIPRGRW
jgi:hypothetical protein